MYRGNYIEHQLKESCMMYDDLACSMVVRCLYRNRDSKSNEQSVNFCFCVE